MSPRRPPKPDCLQTQVLKPRYSLVKYVFTDIKGFTQNPEVDVQAKKVQTLNRVVCEALGIADVPNDSRVLIPTGDGVCIGCLDISGSATPDVSLALAILALLDKHNKKHKPGDTRRFDVRIGINHSTDLIVNGINGAPNVVGSGINYAQRIMDCADDGQILLSRGAYDTLRNFYRPSAFRHAIGRIKHDETIDLYQFVGDSKHPGLSLTEPTRCQICDS